MDGRERAEILAAERRRVVRILEVHEADIPDHLFVRLINLVNGGRDFDAPDDAEDRLPGM